MKNIIVRDYAEVSSAQEIKIIIREYGIILGINNEIN